MQLSTNVVKKLTEMYEQEKRQSDIADEFNKANIASPVGDRWTQTLVSRAAIQIGLRRQKRKSIKKKRAVATITKHKIVPQKKEDVSEIISLIMCANLMESKKLALIKVLLN